VNVQFALISIFDRNSEDFRLKPCSIAHLAGFARHERANAVTGEFALGFLIKPLHLRQESLEWLRNFLLSILGEAHFNRRPISAEVEGLFELLRQIAKRNVLIDMKMSYQRLLQMPVICLHPLCPASPRRDCPFCERFARIGDHQVWIAGQLRAEPMTSRACPEMTVKGKMSGS